jgi:glycosyltransferase involved in cell wall biosynthesis
LRFLVVGTGAEEALIRDRAVSAGVMGGNFRMLPPVPKACMPTLFARATVSMSLFVPLPEMWNNSANKFFDGLAAGKPILINYPGWQKELLESSGAGFSVSHADPASAARQLTDFVSTPGAVATAGAAALRLARESFDRSALADRLLRVLEQVAGAGHPASA